MGRRGENIRKRKDGRWEARLIIGHGPEGRTLYRSVYGKTYLEAKNKRMELLRKTQAYPAKESADPELRMTQLFEEWLQDKKDRVKQSTYAGYQRLIDTHLDPDLGKYRLSELNDELLDRFLRDCLNFGRLDGKGGLSPKTVADIRSMLLLCLRYAKQKQYSCPSFDHLFCPRVKQPRISILSMEEQAKLENVLMEYEGNGIIISAASGTGKTTHARLWRDLRRALIINGDRAVCAKTAEGWTGYGLPWSGTSGEQINRSVAIRALVVLHRGETNEAHRISALEAFHQVFAHVLYPSWDKALAEKMMDLLESFLRDVPIFLLSCRPDAESVDVLHAALAEVLHE